MHSPLLIAVAWITFAAVVAAIQARTGRTRQHEDTGREPDSGEPAEPPPVRAAA